MACGGGWRVRKLNLSTVKSRLRDFNLTSLAIMQFKLSSVQSFGDVLNGLLAYSGLVWVSAVF